MAEKHNLTPFPIDRAVAILRKEVPRYAVPIVGHYVESPFKVLISTLLSLRTKDKTTAAAAQRLFAKADTPEAIMRIPLDTLEKLIYPVGFYKNKAKTLRHVCHTLLEKYWIEYNDLLVTYGQNVCLPVSPHCSKCPLAAFCPKTGVTRHR